MSSKTDIYHITIHDWVFYDPKFKKKYAGYFPISRMFYSSKVVQKLSSTELTYVIALLDLAHTYGSASFDLPSTLLRANGQLALTLLSKLQEKQILSFLINKEIKEVINKEKIKTSEHWFYKFITETLGTLDLGLLNYLTKAEKAFVNEQGFNEWVDLLVLSSNFQKADLKHQQKYFLKAFKDELRDRGCL